MQVNDLKESRLEKLKKIRDLGWNPYPPSYDKKHSIKEALENEGKKVQTAGRLMSFREHGNIAFADLKDESGKIQIFFQKTLLGDEFKNIRLLDIGDFIGVEGEVGKTVAGEISILPVSFTLLSKATLPLPSEWFGIKDVETRYRQRYLDLVLNNEAREIFDIRTRLVSGVREYLDNLGFWEVETPTLQLQYGGANAKPFMTHMNALDQDVYLRIADELYLKRLIVGGYEKVYEICKDFRNEGIDQTHFPEFTMIEWYESYADYQTVMDRAEGLFKHLAQKINGHTRLKVDKNEVDIGNKWPRIEMSEIMKEKLGLEVEKETAQSLLEYAKKNLPDIQLIGGETKGQLVFAIFDHTIPKLLIEPTFIIDYPEEISPLSKAHRTKPGWVERFEGYIGGKEIFDGWSELTDPVIQRERFSNDSQAVRKDKEEAQMIDEDFLEAMEYGMPPFGGIGLGIDRLTMFFTNKWGIKEVVLFPTLKSEGEVKKSNKIKKSVSNVPSVDADHQDFSKKIVIVLNKELPQWQAMNSVGHISAFIGNKMQEAFDTGESFIAKNEDKFPRNSQYPIIALTAGVGQLKNLLEKVRESGLLYHAFIREMIETTNDLEIETILADKDGSDIEILGVGIFGENDEVEKLTKNFSLWK